MRFFSGVRSGSGDKKKVSASELFRQKQSGKAPREKTADEKYKEVMENKMNKMMENAIMGIKKPGARLPGTKQDDGPPKELSKNAKIMLQMLAMQKAQKEAKKEKKLQQQEKWAANSKKKADALAKSAKDAEIQRQKDSQTDGWW